MKEPPGFGAALLRLLQRRELGLPELADHAGLTVPALRAVLAGAPPDAGLLRPLAAALRLHAVDLLVLAGLPVPDGLMPLDPAAARWAPGIVQDGVHLSAPGRRELLRIVRSLPQEERPSGSEPAQPGPVPDGPGGKLVRMLRHRNLRPSGLATTLAVVTPSYLSAAAYGVIGSDRRELTSRLVMDFATLLGIDARDLSALTGVALPESPPPPAPEAGDAAALLWEARRLSAAQAQYVAELARAMRPEPRNHYVLNLPGASARSDDRRPAGQDRTGGTT
ncbi:hypothetical protein ACFVUH_17400 [Kitasatospora sp. NPDC058032]|uniref:hypothetical protein n=1 Tax=Kitasatospora sp. NPDC058032 TaxID=3346307 RepID=UPI0036D7ED49